MVWGALKVMRRQQMEAAAVAAEPLARFTWMYVNSHIGKDSKPMPLESFRVYRMPGDDRVQDAGISAEAAAAVLSLANDGKVPPYILGAWSEVQKAADANPVEPPKPRLLVSDDGMVAIVAPKFLEQGIRGGLVGAGDRVGGVVTVRDLDRPLLTWRIRVPERQGAGWVEANLLMLLAEP